MIRNESKSGHGLSLIAVCAMLLSNAVNANDCSTLFDYWSQVFHQPYWDYIAERHPELAPLRSEVTGVFKVWYPKQYGESDGFESTILIRGRQMRLFIPMGNRSFDKIRVEISSRPFLHAGGESPVLAMYDALNRARERMHALVPERISVISRIRIEDASGFGVVKTEVFVPIDNNHVQYALILARHLSLSSSTAP